MTDAGELILERKYVMTEWCSAIERETMKTLFELQSKPPGWTAHSVIFVVFRIGETVKCIEMRRTDRMQRLFDYRFASQLVSTSPINNNFKLWTFLPDILIFSLANSRMKWTSFPCSGVMAYLRHMQILWCNGIHALCTAHSSRNSLPFIIAFALHRFIFVGKVHGMPVARRRQVNCRYNSTIAYASRTSAHSFYHTQCPFGIDCRPPNN